MVARAVVAGPWRSLAVTGLEVGDADRAATIAEL